MSEMDVSHRLISTIETFELPELNDIIDEARTSGFIQMQELSLVISEAGLDPEQAEEIYSLLESLKVKFLDADDDLDRSRQQKKYTAAHIIELAKRIERGDPKAFDEMVEANEGLVKIIAPKYLPSGMEIEDLEQEGRIGLYQAIQRFEWRRGLKFSTYAQWWIHKAIGDAVDHTSAGIRIPREKATQRRALRRISNQLEAQLGRQPTTEELAKQAQLDVSTVKAALDATTTSNSVNVMHEAGLEVADENIEHPLESILDEEKRDTLRRYVSELPPRERLVMELKAGLQGGPPKTQVEIGKMLHVSNQMISIIEIRARRRLAKISEAREEELQTQGKVLKPMEQKKSFAELAKELKHQDLEFLDLLSRDFPHTRIAVEFEIGVVDVRHWKSDLADKFGTNVDGLVSLAPAIIKAAGGV